VGVVWFGRLVEAFCRDDVSGILRAEWHRQEQTSDQRGSEVTDKCHTSMPSTNESEVPPSLDFSPYPSPESNVVKDPSFRVVPRVFASLVDVPLVPLVGVAPDLGAVVRPHRPALELL